MVVLNQAVNFHDFLKKKKNVNNYYIRSKMSCSRSQTISKKLVFRIFILILSFYHSRGKNKTFLDIVSTENGEPKLSINNIYNTCIKRYNHHFNIFQFFWYLKCTIYLDIVKVHRDGKINNMIPSRLIQWGLNRTLISL